MQYLTTQALKELVVVRLTKGTTQLFNHPSYVKNRDAVIAQVMAMTRRELFIRYPEFTKGVKE